jgi:Protein of unknown function (DUF3043)
VFRRRADDSSAVLDPEPEQGTDPGSADETSADETSARPGFTAAKGRPTPKRSQAEKRRRTPYTAPGDRKAAAAQGRDRDRDRGERQRRMEAVRKGEDWALPRKDQGPVRALARDVVDSRRGISEYYLYAVGALVVLLFVPKLRGNPIIDYLILVILVVIVGEGWFVGRKVASLAQQRFPGQPTRGIKVYTAMRGTQIRRMRVPAPRVKPGDKI